VSPVDVASSVLLLAGSFFVITGGVGLLRFPEFYVRTHSAGLTDSAGAALILLGLLIQAPDWSSAVRLVLILLFLLVTSPTATHALAHAARNDGVPIWVVDREQR
jgi:multicomponent Na+:H+ antiporter subunit G